MREQLSVSYARTGLAKAGRGGFNITPAMTMAAHAISSAVEKAGIEPELVEDVALGNGAHGAANLGRLASLLAGLPVTTGGNTIQRHCSSGLNSIAVAANHIRLDGVECAVGAGVESISIPGGGFGGTVNMDPKLTEMYPGDLHGDDRDRRHRRRALQRGARLPGRVLLPVADAHGTRSGERLVRGRDRPDGHQDEARRQGDQGRVDRRLRRHRRRNPTAPRPRSKVSRSCSPCVARATTSPWATPASSPTAQLPW